MQDSGIYELTMILGAATLLLWGVRMARTGVMRVYGPEIHRILPRALRSRWIALATGAGAAPLLQSSLAVAVFTSGLAAVGAIPVAEGLLLLLGMAVDQLQDHEHKPDGPGPRDKQKNRDRPVHVRERMVALMIHRSNSPRLLCALPPGTPRKTAEKGAMSPL